MDLWWYAEISFSVGLVFLYVEKSQVQFHIRTYNVWLCLPPLIPSHSCQPLFFPTSLPPHSWLLLHLCCLTHDVYVTDSTSRKNLSPQLIFLQEVELLYQKTSKQGNLLFLYTLHLTQKTDDAFYRDLTTPLGEHKWRRREMGREVTANPLDAYISHVVQPALEK